MAWTLTVMIYFRDPPFARCENPGQGMSAIHKLADEELLKIMQGFLTVRYWKIVQKDFKRNNQGACPPFSGLRTLAEIFARETGFNRGLGGSMHAFFTPFGVYPNNAIVVDRET